MKRFAVLLCVVAAGLAPAPVGAGEADPRAIAACKSQSKTFVQLSECLPNAHVGIKLLDAFDRVYTSDAAHLKNTCIELNNDDASASATCVINAIEAALRLQAALPQGSTLDDPVFAAVADTGKFEKLKSERDIARQVFPDQRVWGGGTYHPYK